jgi:hypothetical protein
MAWIPAQLKMHKQPYPCPEGQKLEEGEEEMWFQRKVSIGGLQVNSGCHPKHFPYHSLLIVKIAYVLNYRVGKCNVERLVVKLPQVTGIARIALQVFVLHFAQ